MKKLLLYILLFFSAPAFGQTIAGGAAHSFAICNDSTVRGWGGNVVGMLGNGTNTTSNVPVQVSFITAITAVAGGNTHSLALKSDSTVWAWGENNNGQLGNGTWTNSNVPLIVSSLTSITAIAAGHHHSLVVKNDGTVWAWGYNWFGQLGNGTSGSGTNSNIPVQVSFLTGIIAVAAGYDYSIALKNDGTVWAWGVNGSGQLGNGNNIDSNVPVQVSSLTGISAITAGGGSHSLALKSDSTVWAWGNNSLGQLGNGNNTNSNVPVQVSSITGITAIAAGGAHTLALKNDNTVWAWGRNFFGQLGNGNNTNSNVPVQVSSLTGIIFIGTGGGNHTLALKNDGTVWTCGENSSYGQLGNGTWVNSNIPVQVISLCPVWSSVNEIREEVTVTVYPNPSEGHLTLTLSEGEGTVEVYNTLGELVFFCELRTTNTELDLRSKSKGIYFVKVVADNKVYSQKVVIE